MKRSLQILQSLVFLCACIIALSSCDDNGRKSSDGNVITREFMVLPQVISTLPNNKSITIPTNNYKALFDGNTGTYFKTTESVRIALSFDREISLTKFRIFGSTSYICKFYKVTDGKEERIHELSIIDSVLKDSWNSFIPENSLALRECVLEIVPGSIPNDGISELEFWGTENVTVGEKGCIPNLDEIKTFSEMESIISNQPFYIKSFTGKPDSIFVQTNEEKKDASIVITLPFDPIFIKHAYLAYAAQGVLSQLCINHSINNHSLSNGFDAGNTTTDLMQNFIEEINPDNLLQGSNRIIFTSGKVSLSIKNISLVCELYNGWNRVIDSSENVLHDGDIQTSASVIAHGGSMDVSLDRYSELQHMAIHCNRVSDGEARIQFSTPAGWRDIDDKKSISMKNWVPGWNIIPVPAINAQKLRVLFNSSSKSMEIPKISIDELEVNASPVSSAQSVSKLVISYPRNGEYLGRTALISGFVSSDISSVQIQGKNYPVIDGSFFATVSKDESGYQTQTDDAQWSLTVDAAGSSSSLSKKIQLSKNLLSSQGEGAGSQSNGGASTGGDGKAGVNNNYTATVLPDSSSSLSFRNITLDIPAGAVEGPTEITVIPLSAKDIATLNPGMVNITAPAAGYRFLFNGAPHGQFRKPIKITFGFDRIMLMQGQDDKDVYMYFYDESDKQWKRLKRVDAKPEAAVTTSPINASIRAMIIGTGVSQAADVITSETTHFTDIINATVTVPEHPDPLSYNPNSIKDIKTGNPAEEIALVEPPVPNNSGDASLSYPITIPKGRCGMQPGVAVQYSSSNANGWLGVGWDIPQNAIALDTRFGVPRYNETDKYVLNGSELVAIEGDMYRERVEGAFRKIVRHGNSPAEYWWEVIDKNGTRFLYGRDNGRLKSYRNNFVFMWYLEKIIDTNGNCVDYVYSHDASDPEVEGEPFAQIYISEIYYTGQKDNRGPYKISFESETGRKDVFSTCRGGFKIVMRQRLKSISISFEGTVFRTYVFNYIEGVFGKTLLERIDQYGEGKTLFHSHSFEYFDEVTDEENKNILHGFNNEKIDMANAKSIQSVYGIDKKRIGSTLAFLKETEDNTNTSHLTHWSKIEQYRVTPTIKYSFESINSDGGSTKIRQLELIDINGDGLPDQVYSENEKIYCRLNTGYDQINNSFRFGNEREISSLSGIASTLEKTIGKTSFTRNLVNRSKRTGTVHENGENKNTQHVYLIDVNADKLIDLVVEGIVYFNALDTAGFPVFSTKVPDGFNMEKNPLIQPAGTTAPTVENNDVLEHRRDDPILLWEAPYDGAISISGDASLIFQSFFPAEGAVGEPDGVHLSIQKNKNLIWSADIPAGSTESVTPESLGLINVQKGDSIIFRVNSINDPSFDAVKWNPVIEYNGLGSPAKDENGLELFRYEATESFNFFTSDDSWNSVAAGTVSITGAVDKKEITSDDIHIRIFRENAQKEISTIVDETIPGTITGAIELALPDNIEISESDAILCELSSDTPIDWSSVTWRPSIVYNSMVSNEEMPAMDGNWEQANTFKLPVNIISYPVRESESFDPFIATIDQEGAARIQFSAERRTAAPFRQGDRAGQPAAMQPGSADRAGLLVSRHH
jgi:hypothetical protein